MAPTTSKKILENVLHRTMETIVSKTAYQSSSEVHLKYNTKASPLYFRRGNKHLDDLVLIIKPEASSTLSTGLFLTNSQPRIEFVSYQKNLLDTK